MLLGDIFWGRESHQGQVMAFGVEWNLHAEAYSCENRQQAKHCSIVESEEVVWKDRVFRETREWKRL